MAVARSHRIFGPSTLSNAGAGALLYTVPALKTAIFRCLRIVNESGAIRNVKLGINSVAAGALVLQHQGIATLEIYEDSGLLVLAAGEALWGFANGGNVTICGNGALVTA